MSADFRTTSLGSYLSSIQSGWSPACDERRPGANEWGVVRVSAVTQGTFREDEAKRLPSSLEPRPRLEIHPGDLLMARANGAKNLVGVSCLVGSVRGRLMLSDKTLRLRPDPSKATTRFLHHVLCSRQVRSQVESLLGGSTGQANISQENVAALQVPEVPFGDQSRIVEILDSVTESERVTQSVIEKLHIMRLGMVLRYMAPVSVAVAPLGWRRVRLKEVVTSVDYGISAPLDRDIAGVPTLRMNNLRNGRADLKELRYAREGVEQRHLLRRGDVLFNRTNSIDHVGRAGVWEGELKEATFASYLVRLNPDIGKVDPRYLVEWLRHPVTRHRVRSIATVAVQQVNVNPSRLRELEIDLPIDLSEQIELVSSLSAVDRRIDAESEKIEKIHMMKEALVVELFSNNHIRTAV